MADRSRLGGARRRVTRMRQSDMAPWVIAALIVTALYVARAILIPITLAVFLSFLLSPIVGQLRRLNLPRPPAVILSVMIALGAFAAMASVITSQAATLAGDAPAYAERISDKVGTLRETLHHDFAFLTGETRLQRQVVREEVVAAKVTAADEAPPAPVPVEVHEPPPTAMEEVETILLPALAPLATALIVLVVTIFILLYKADLVDRLIRLIGVRDLHRTSTALDDAAQRLGRYFLSQLIVNICFGAVIWLGLYLIGVPSPGLWAILAALLRFVPYVGIIIGALAPVALAAAIDPGWMLAIYVVLLFLLVDMTVGYFIEPFVYGHSGGLSPVTVIIAALFWAWIWGPIGLLLSTPLTLMLVVIGRHIPALEIFDVILGDRPALSPAETLYQRVLSGQTEAAIDHADEALEKCTLAVYYSDTAFEALRLAWADGERKQINRVALKRIGDEMFEVVEALGDHVESGEGKDRRAIARPVAVTDWGEDRAAAHSVTLIPARGPLDAALSAMLAQMLERRGCAVQELHRGELSISNWASIDPATQTVCFIGLFDERASAFIAGLAEQLREVTPAIDIVMGIRLVDEDDETEEEATPAPKGGKSRSLIELCDRIVEPAKAKEAAI